jgi:hypothetical protein
MQQYAICVDPLLRMFHEKLTGITIRNRNNKITSIAYADDITIIITSPLDIPAVQTALNIYEKATGARINISKSKIMAMGKWDTSINIFNIPYYARMKILGINFTSTTEQTVDVNWSIMADQIKVQAQNAYIRNLTIDKRIQYIHNYLLARVWYTEQVLPLTEEYRRQIETATSWYLWRGSVFRVPLSTLQRSKREGLELCQHKRKMQSITILSTNTSKSERIIDNCGLIATLGH